MNGASIRPRHWSTPTRTRDIYPILDQVTAGLFDDSGGDGEPWEQIVIVVQHMSVLEQIIRVDIDRLTLIPRGRVG